MTLRPGQKILALGLADVRFAQPKTAAAPWYDPNNEGLSVWAAWQADGAASLDASYVDLSRNGHNLSTSVAPAWDAVNGWTFTPANGEYLDTGFTCQIHAPKTFIVWANLPGSPGPDARRGTFRTSACCLMV